MDRTMAIEHLAQAERHVREGSDHIAKQRAIIADLERDGLDATQAKALLCQFEGLHALHVADRDRLRGEVDYPKLVP